MTAELEHKAVEATTRVDSDLGEFSALAATYDVDRVKDRIRFGAFEKTIARWQAPVDGCRCIGTTAAKPAM
jgi:hypothetical protein